MKKHISGLFLFFTIGCAQQASAQFERVSGMLPPVFAEIAARQNLDTATRIYIANKKEVSTKAESTSYVKREQYNDTVFVLAYNTATNKRQVIAGYIKKGTVYKLYKFYSFANGGGLFSAGFNLHEKGVYLEHDASFQNYKFKNVRNDTILIDLFGFYVLETTANILTHPVSKVQYFVLQYFEQGASVDDEQHYLVNEKGDHVSDSYEDMFTMGKAVVFKKKDKYGLLGIDGKVLLPAKYDAAKKKGNLVEFRTGNLMGGLYGLYTHEGKEIVPLSKEADNIEFKDKLAAVPVRGKWGFIDENGNTVLPFIYHKAMNFSEGLAAVEISDKKGYGFINKTGQFVIPEKYSFVMDGGFKNGKAEVTDDILHGKNYFISKTGEVIR